MNRLTGIVVCGWLMVALGACTSSSDTGNPHGSAGQAGQAGAGAGAGAGGSSGTAGTGGSTAGAGAGGEQGGAAGLDASVADGDAAPDVIAEADVTVEPDAEPVLEATLTTSMGTIVVELNGKAAPITVDNFKKYADAKFYDGLIFHRVIPDFMIQGGGYDADLNEKTTLFSPIVDEAKTSGLSNVRGTIAMARSSDPSSATSQFYINTVDNPSLDPGTTDPDGYAVFGKVTQGMDVVDAISKVPTHHQWILDDVPVTPIVIQALVVAQK